MIFSNLLIGEKKIIVRKWNRNTYLKYIISPTMTIPIITKPIIIGMQILNLAERKIEMVDLKNIILTVDV